MPAKSKEQQRLFGMVHAYQKGELKNPSKEVKDIADDISYKDAKDFAETKHKGLPNKVKEKKNESKDSNVVKLSESTLRKIVAESVKKVLKEEYDGNYLQLIKEEMHRLYELEQKVPNHLQPEIHSMVISMQAMLEEAQRNVDFDNWNY